MPAAAQGTYIPDLPIPVFGTVRAGHHPPVGVAELLQAKRVFKFAKAAYGLQSIIWGKGQ